MCRMRWWRLIAAPVVFMLLAAGCVPVRNDGASSAPSLTTSPASALATPSPEGQEGPAKPNALTPLAPGGNPEFAPVPGADTTKNGPAATINGNPVAGQVVFVQNCVVCHGADGIGEIPNPGSDDGTVPPLNPIDPGFTASAKGDAATFAREIDLFVQHGSRPSGPNPTFSMVPFGDASGLSQQQIADVEAYVMQLNGVTWPK